MFGALGEASTALAALIAAATSSIIGWVTHKRATAVHNEELRVDHAKMIQAAYKDILDELRSELDRRREAERSLRKKVETLQEELDKETEHRQKLEDKLNRLIGDVEDAAHEEVQEHEEDYHDQ